MWTDTDEVDLVAFVDTLANETSPAVTHRVRERYQSDLAFRREAAPLLLVWHRDLSLQEPIPVQAEVEFVWARTRQQITAIRVVELSRRSKQPSSNARVSDRRAVSRRLLAPSYVLGGVLVLALAFGLVRSALTREWIDAIHQTLLDRAHGLHTQIIRAGAADAARDLLLPDGSHVVLGSRSWLRFDDTFGRTDRTLQLEGDATFTVSDHSSMMPFIIEDISVRGMLEGIPTPSSSSGVRVLTIARV